MTGVDGWWCRLSKPLAQSCSHIVPFEKQRTISAVTEGLTAASARRANDSPEARQKERQAQLDYSNAADELNVWYNSSEDSSNENVAPSAAPTKGQLRPNVRRPPGSPQVISSESSSDTSPPMKASKKPARGQPRSQPPSKAPRKTTALKLTAPAPPAKGSRMTTRRMAKPSSTSSSPDPTLI
ncbi:hypothetical protein N7488_005582 [Penicillium malachiteum]|nr:hypothetical protein N7488_005582 [Penicillium malachiteum]